MPGQDPPDNGDLAVPALSAGTTAGVVRLRRGLSPDAPPRRRGLDASTAAAPDLPEDRAPDASSESLVLAAIGRPAGASRALRLR